MALHEFKAVRKKLQIARVDLEYCAVAFCKFLEANIDVLEDVPADAPEDAPEDSLEDALEDSPRSRLIRFRRFADSRLHAFRRLSG